MPSPFFEGNLTTGLHPELVPEIPGRELPNLISLYDKNYNLIPWPTIRQNVSYYMTNFGWSYTMYSKRLYLFMPIKNVYGKIISYVLRTCSTSESPKVKYLNSPGEKYYWVSSYMYTSVDTNKVVICEGIADAAYIHYILTLNGVLVHTVALLGTTYNNSLNNYLRGKEVYIMLDGGKGIDIIPPERFITLSLIEKFRKNGIKALAVSTPVEQDPTDMNYTNIKRVLREAGFFNVEPMF